MTSTAPTIDGAIDSLEWEPAAIADGFIQFQPDLGSPSTFRSQAQVMYDEGHLYVAFRFFDSEPPTAQLTRRDADLEDDDAAIILLDSNNDHRSAFFFMTNALGTQTDGQVTNDGRTVDRTWDATWQSAAQLTDFGWTVEIAIPFTSIGYTAGEDQTWGINFGRTRRRNLELSYWAGPLDQQFRVSQAGALLGLDIAPPERRLRVIPYGQSRVEEGRHVRWDAGGDVRYAVTPDMAAYLTVNPDFATIEADQERINLTRFELFLTEKRPFFLESAQQFRQRIRTFYTRRIVDLSVGGQVLGKQGPWTIAGLATRSQFPVESPDSGPGFVESPSAIYAVGRVQRDIFGTSNIALMAANRSLEGVNQGSLEMDATLFFTKTLGMTGQAVQSWGLFGNGTWAYFIRPAYDSPTSHFHVRYTYLGDHFAENVNAIGFIRDDNRRELDSALEHTFWIGSGAIERIIYDSNYNIYWSVRGLLRSWQIDQGIEIDFRNRISMEATYQEEFKRFEKDFRNRQLGVELGYNTREFQSAQIGYRAGRNFDLDFQLWAAEAAYKVTPQLAVQYELQRLLLKPDPEDESTWIHVLRADQFFTKDLFVKVFFQTNSAIDRRNVQVVAVYRYRPPFGTLQFAYQRGTAEFGERSQQGNTFFFKVSAVF
ncbi:MAG: DUF5916 domain-containing protein [Gemmatimonadota bacterium]